jgi:flagellar basal body-associated protein FliL
MTESRQTSGSISSSTLTLLILLVLALLSAVASAVVMWKGQHGADQETMRSTIPMPYHQAFGH